MNTRQLEAAWFGKTASLNLWTKWRKVTTHHDKLVRSSYQKLLQKLAADLKKDGGELDLRRSSLGSYNHGSDGTRMEGTLYVEDLLNEARGKYEVEDSLEAIVGYGALKYMGSYGKWQYDVTES